MIACLRLQVKFYFILTHNNLIFIRKIIGSLGVAVKKKFGGGVFWREVPKKIPQTCFASSLPPKRQDKMFRGKDVSLVEFELIGLDVIFQKIRIVYQTWFPLK